MKPEPILPRSPDAFHKWSDEHRAQVWEMIEKLGKGEVSHQEARELLREEKKALTAVSKRVFGFKLSHSPHGRHAHSTSHLVKAPKTKKSATPRASAPPQM